MTHRNLPMAKAIVWALFVSASLCGAVVAQKGDEKKSVEAAKSAEEQLAAEVHAKKVASAIARGKLSAKLEHMQPEPKSTGPRWSPKGTKVELKSEREGLVGRLAIGKVADFAVRWELKKAGDDATFYIDLNRDGKLRPDESTTIKATERRGSFWYSGQHLLQIPGKSKAGRPYPVSFWYVTSAEPDDDEPPVMRWSRRGWTEGSFQLGDRKAYVVMTEGRQDGEYTKTDSWGLGFDQQSAYRNSTAPLSRHSWLDGVAYKPLKFDGEGMSILFEAFDPGFTEQEEKERNDPFAADRRLARAKKPVKFGKDLKDALAVAKREDKLVFVDFVTTWCGPCKSMDRYVYTAKPVVDRMQNVIAVQLDGDEEKEIVEKYEVEGYPTLLVLNPEGEVLKRTIGYTKSTAVIQLLNDAKRTGK